MRHCCLFLSGLLLLVTLSTGFLFADEKTLKLESVVIDTFDGAGSATYDDGSPIIWKVMGSKFSTEGYPRLTYFENEWPYDLFGPNPENADELQVLGLNSKFDRMGYNQFEIIPGTGEGDDWMAQPINLPGRVQTVDLWVWGSRFKYAIEMHFLDFQGLAYRLDLIQSDNKRAMGSLNFSGWKNMYLDIPSYIKQSVVYQPQYKNLRISKIVVYTDPNENVNDFYVFLDHLKILTDKHESHYDGVGLTSPEKLQKFQEGE